MCLIINELKPKSKDLSFFNLTKQLLSLSLQIKRTIKTNNMKTIKEKTIIFATAIVAIFTILFSLGIINI